MRQTRPKTTGAVTTSSPVGAAYSPARTSELSLKGRPASLDPASYAPQAGG